MHEKPGLVNKFNPKKLLNSKWTAVHPHNKERHFIVVKLIVNEERDDCIEGCFLQSVMHKRDYEVSCQALKDGEIWQQGWK
ncbi:MAG TPA: TIGR02450 family Trp-rich protein [Thiomicrospira sp.]|jgi:tryptophan-rich hypothetical protein|nr:TIGR02450 family Trp-rich protein [Thiomicrospira sp.]